MNSLERTHTLFQQRFWPIARVARQSWARKRGILTFVPYTTFLLVLLTCRPFVSPAQAASSPAGLESPTIYEQYANYAVAINLSNGSLRWKHAFDSQLSQWPVASQNQIFVTLQNGEIYALQPADGAIIWHTSLLSSSAVQSGFFFAGLLVGDGDSVFAGTTDGYIYALDRNTGHVLWKVSAPKCSQPPPSASEDACTVWPAAQANGTLYIVEGVSSGFYALDSQQGTLLWYHADPVYIDSTSDDGTFVYLITGQVGNSVTITAFDTASGRNVLTFPDHQGYSVQFANQNHVLYLYDGSTQQLSAYESPSGRLLWHKPTNDDLPGTRFSTAHGMLFLRDSVFNADQGSTDLFAYDASGNALWHWHVDAWDGVDAPRWLENQVYFSTISGVYALNPATGQVNWQDTWQSLGV